MQHLSKLSHLRHQNPQVGCYELLLDDCSLEISTEDPLWAVQLLELLFALSERVVPTVSVITLSEECNT